MGLIPDQETIQVGLTLDQGTIQEGLISDQKTIQVGLISDQEAIQVGLILYQTLLTVAIQGGHKSIQAILQEDQTIPTLLMLFPKTCSSWLH